jgi:hypothetical protein
VRIYSAGCHIVFLRAHHLTYIYKRFMDVLDMMQV